MSLCRIKGEKDRKSDRKPLLELLLEVSHNTEKILKVIDLREVRNINSDHKGNFLYYQIF